MRNLPHKEVLQKFKVEISTISSRFDYLLKQLEDYEKDMFHYDERLKTMLQNRKEKRQVGNTNNPAAKEQLELSEGIQNVKKSLD